MPPYRDELHAAIEAAAEAAALIRYHAGRAAGVRLKGAHDLVTEVDEAAQRLILERLLDAFPGYDVLAEEAGRDRGARVPERPRWIVDPIDGTTNFTHGVAPYAVSIALQEAGGELVLGVIHEVVADEVFAAVRGQGLTVNGRPARVSATENLADALVTTGFPFREFGYVDAYLPVLRAFMERARGVRRPGSAAVDLAYVACGRFDGFFEAGLAPWDVAAGIVLVREGGGRVSAMTEGTDPLFGRQLVASNAPLHAAMCDLARPLGEAHRRAVAAGTAAAP